MNITSKGDKEKHWFDSVLAFWRQCALLDLLQMSGIRKSRRSRWRVENKQWKFYKDKSKQIWGRVNRIGFYIYLYISLRSIYLSLAHDPNPWPNHGETGFSIYKSRADPRKISLLWSRSPNPSGSARTVSESSSDLVSAPASDSTHAY
jgi:hypothetical protein